VSQDKVEEVFSIYNYYEESSSNKSFLLDDDSMNSQHKVEFMQKSIGHISSQDDGVPSNLIENQDTKSNDDENSEDDLKSFRNSSFD